MAWPSRLVQNLRRCWKQELEGQELLILLAIFWVHSDLELLLLRGSEEI